MKLKKIAALLVAGLMVATLAMSAAANPLITTNIIGNCLDEGGPTNTTHKHFENGRWGLQAHVAGSSVDAPGLKEIDPWIITGVRFRFSNIGWHVADEDGSNAQGSWKAGDKILIGATGVNIAPTDFVSRDFLLKEGEPNGWTITRNITTDKQETGYLQVGAALWEKGTTARVQVEILGQGGIVLNNGETEETLAARLANPTPTTRTPSGGSRTGLGGVAILGGVGLLAAGAVLVSRKRR